MQLRDYLRKRRMTYAEFGKLLAPPVSVGKVNHWVNGTRRVSLAEALQIEVVTDGEVPPSDLVRPELATSAEEPGVAHG